jgi:hypothetical protein
MQDRPAVRISLLGFHLQGIEAMKKLFVLAALCGLGLFMIGCGSETTVETSPTPEGGTTTTVESGDATTTTTTEPGGAATTTTTTDEASTTTTTEPATTPEVAPVEKPEGDAPATTPEKAPE